MQTRHFLVSTLVFGAALLARPVAAAPIDAVAVLVATADSPGAEVEGLDRHDDHAQGHDDHGHGGGIRWVSPIVGNDGKTGVLWLLINFGVLMWLLNRLLFTPLRRRQVEQHTRLRDELGNATRAREEAESIISEYRGRVARLDQEIAELLADAKARAEADRREIIAAAEREAARIQAAARAAAEREAEQTRRTIEQEVLDRAIAKAEQILRQRIVSTDQQRMVDDYVQRLDRTDLGGVA